MSSLTSALRQETAFVYLPQPQQTVSPPWASQRAANANGLYNFTLQSVGGVVFLQDCLSGAQPERGIHWQIENSATGALHLTEFTIDGGACGPRITVEVGLQLFPALAATGTSDGRLRLAVLLSNGLLMHAELRCSLSSREPILTTLTAASLRPLDITQQLATLGTPTTLSATQEAVIVGGGNGSILCIPLAALDESNASRCFELRDSSWALTKLIPGVLFRPRQPAALASIPVTLSGRPLLLVSYDDGMLRAFNVARRQQVATLEMETPSFTATGGAATGSRQVVPTYVSAEGNGSASSSSVTLVVQFEATDTLQRCTYSYTLSSSGSGRLALSSPTELAVEAGTVVLEARVSGDTVWLLVRSQGKAKVLGYNRSTGAVVSSAVLTEAVGEGSGVGALASGSNGAEVDQELWDWLLQAFPEELSAENQVCQQVLVPGQTCRGSLRDALSYHGAQLRSVDVDSATHGVLRGWIQSAVMAIQRRTPTASSAECWQSFLATYRAAWARRHPPLGLVLHRDSPDWLGLARGGSVLCVLRRGTGVEALQGADAVGSLEMPPHLDAVHRCAAEAGALLGPLAQEACLSLLVAGVDPLEHLVPRLCELWNGGPGVGGGSGRGTSMGSGSSGGGLGSTGGASGPRAAALTDSAREAQQRWRQRRLQVVISMGQRLGSLANAAETIRAYLAMLRLLSSQSSAELSAAARPGAAGAAASGGSAPVPSRAAAAFLVSTCRQVSRAAAAAARDAALLLGLVLQQGSLPLDRETVGRLEGKLLPEACGLLRRAALGLWLTGTPSTHDEGADMEPALAALRHLRLGSPHGKGNRSGGGALADAPLAAFEQPSHQPAAHVEASLAARLLPAFCTAFCGGGGEPGQRRRLDLLTGAESAGLLYTLYLQYGEQPTASMAARVLQLGYQLFQVGEYGNLADLAALAGATGGAEAGPQFLRGLGIICALALERQQSGAAAGARAGARAAAGGPSVGTRRSERISEAAGCFFRAAASLASEAGDTLRTILRDLQAELAGAAGSGSVPSEPAPAAATTGAAGAGPGAQSLQQRREVALLQLHFCEAVMQLFEREGAPEGAVMFASAALGHLRTAYDDGPDPAAAATAAPAAPLLPGEDALMLAAATEAATERTSREGRLWSNIYSYCVEMRQYDRAYAALLANPLPAARLQSLRHLVHVLAQDGQLQTLCTLPFAGVAVLPIAASVDAPGGGAAANQLALAQTSTSASAVIGSGGFRIVSLLSEALDLLHRRAHNCDLSESPQPYQVLYDFLMCRSDLKGAARAMVAYAWRLRAEAPGSSEEAVAEALRAYDLAINCLSLLDPETGYLDLTDPWLEKLSPHYHHFQHHAADALPATPSKSPAAAAGDAANASGSRGGADVALRARGSIAGGLTGSFSAGGAGVGPAGAAVGVGVGSGLAPVATVRSLQRERTMLYYCALVASRVAGLEPMRQWDNEEAILRQLLLLGRYEGALVLVAHCHGAPGSDPWARALEAVVSALAAHCTRLQLQDGGMPTGGPALPPTDLFADDPHGDAGAAGGLALGGAAALAGTLGGRAAPLWAKLRQLLGQVAQVDLAAEQSGSGSIRVGWLLRDAAAEAVLRIDPRVDLPQWLLDMFIVPDAQPAAMGSAACGPASLLSLYLRHDRLAAAVELVAGQVEQWGRADVRLRRRHGAAWMPYPQLELLQTKLAIAQQLGQERSGALLAQLNATLAAHLELVATDAERLEPQRAAAAAASAAGLGGGGGGEALGGSFGAGRGDEDMGLGAGSELSPVTPGVSGSSSLFGMGMGGGLRLFGGV